jgi:O-antigen/teichoic acid export membrane protein
LTANSSESRGKLRTPNALLQLAKHSSVYAIGALLSKAASFLMLPLYTAYLSPFDYGVLDIVETTSGMIGLVAGFGMASALGRFYFDFDADDGRNGVVSTAIALAAISSVAVLLVTVPLSGPLVHLLFGADVPAATLIVAFITIALGLVVDLSSIYLRLVNRSVLFVVTSMANLVIGISLNIFFIVALKMGVMGILYSNLITRAVVGVPLTWWMLRQTGWRFEGPLARKMLRYGMPLMPSEIASVAIGYSDRFLINGFLSTADAGIYGMAQKLGTALHYVVTSPFLQAFLMQRFAIGREAGAQRTLADAFKYHMVILIVLSTLLSLFAAEVLLLMTAPAFHSAVSFIPMAALAMVVLATKYHFEYGILREKKTQFHMYINTSTAVLQILLNFFLIRWIGLWGAVLAGLLAYATKSVCYLTISQRLYPVPFELGKFLSLLAGSAVLVAFADLTLGLTWTGFAVKCLLAVVATVLPLALGMLTKGDLARAITLVRGKLGFPDVR